MDGPILVATDGSSASDSALRLGVALAEQKGRRVELIAVVEPIALATARDIGNVPEAYALLRTVQAEDFRQVVSRQIGPLGESARDWTVTMLTGSPAPTIIRYAHERRAQLIVMGAARHAPLHQWMRSETTLQLAGASNIPVLAVAPDLKSLPRRALVAVDFSRFSLRALRRVSEVLGESSHIVVAHVTWTPTELQALPSLAEWRAQYDRDLTTRLENLAEEVRASSGVQVEAALLHGDPAEELIALGSRMNMDLIAGGSHGCGYVGRLLRGRVATRLFRGARCSVLLAPPSLYPKSLDRAEADSAQSEESEDSRCDWSGMRRR